MRFALFLLAGLSLAACQPTDHTGHDGTITTSPTHAYDGIAESDTVHFTGTEPFWGGEVASGTARYTTPENATGKSFAVTRFAGNNGVSFSGKLDGAAFDLMVTPGTCSDGMSDRSYPYTATLTLGDEQRNGCAWTDSKPFSGTAKP